MERELKESVNRAFRTVTSSRPAQSLKSACVVQIIHLRFDVMQHSLALHPVKKGSAFLVFILDTFVKYCCTSSWVQKSDI